MLGLVVVIVVLSVVGLGMVILIHNTTASSADPQIRQQANAIARSYLEEVMLRPFCDPDFVTTTCPADCITNACGACTLVEGSRNLFDDVCDYNGLSDTAGAVDQTGTAIVGLSAFNVSVQVDDTVTLGPPVPPPLDGAVGQVVLVNVSVTHDDNARVNVTLSGYRTNF